MPAGDFLIRTPGHAEWPACRMLVPQAFRCDPPPQALLAFACDGTVAGAAAFHDGERSFRGLDIRVVRTCRRQGVGRSLVERVVELAAQRGHRDVRAAVDTAGLPEAEPFLLATGFRCEYSVLLVEAEGQKAGEVIFPYRDRLLAAGKVPASARIVRPSEVPAEDLARLFTEYVAPVENYHPGYALPLVTDRRVAESAVLTVDGRVEGMVLWDLNRETGRGSVLARVVSERYRGGFGWANALLMATALQHGIELGGRWLRFEVPEDNRDTRNLMRRLEATILNRTACFTRNCHAENLPD